MADRAGAIVIEDAAQGHGAVYKGMRMAGHMGDERVTIKKLRVVRSDLEKNLLLVKGAVPGADGGHIVVRPAVKAPAKKGA